MPLDQAANATSEVFELNGKMALGGPEPSGGQILTRRGRLADVGEVVGFTHHNPSLLSANARW